MSTREKRWSLYYLLWFIHSLSILQPYPSTAPATSPFLYPLCHILLPPLPLILPLHLLVTPYLPPSLACHRRLRSTTPSSSPFDPTPPPPRHRLRSLTLPPLSSILPLHLLVTAYLPLSSASPFPLLVIASAHPSFLVDNAPLLPHFGIQTIIY